jgi:RNA polymerase sigma-70 factor, ECF subfamily
MVTMSAPPQEADADVHSRLRAGDHRAALELLLPRYRDRVFRLALSILRNRTEAEDVTQEIFLRLWRALPGYNAKASLSTWIYAISRNACLSQIRKRRPQVSLDDPDVQLDPAVAGLAAPATEEPATASVIHLLDSLPARYREVVTLFYMEDRSCEQTAAALGLPVGTVKALLHRARRRMIDLAGVQSVR